MLTIGDQFPAFRHTSVVDIDQARPEDVFEVIASDTSGTVGKSSSESGLRR